MTEKIKLAKAPFGSWINVDAEYTARLYYAPNAYDPQSEWEQKHAEQLAVQQAITRRALFEFRVLFVYLVTMVVLLCAGVLAKGTFGTVLLLTSGVMFFVFLVQEVRISMGGR